MFPYNPEFNRCLPDMTRLFEERGFRLRSRRHELDEVEEPGLMKIGDREAFIVVESATASPDSFYLRNPELAIVPCDEDIRVARYAVYREANANPVLAAFLAELDRAS